MMAKEFYIDKFLDESLYRQEDKPHDNEEDFQDVCKMVEEVFNKEWEETDDASKNRKLEREKRAIIGYESESNYYREKIKEILRQKKLMDKWYPTWYPNLCEAVFCEVYGLAGLAPWAYDMTKEYMQSSSAKLIGERLYCLIDGKATLQPQRISRRRREQLKRTLLLESPYERLQYGFHEVYLHNGIRITIFSGDRTKDNEDVMVFRKYILKELTFQQLAALETIPEEAIPMFRAMIAIGYNVIFAGQVRSGKTTFMQTWQRYEDPTLEGLAIATDPETPWHRIMPDVPIMQLVADGSDLDKIIKSLLRGDNDYVLLEEMRDATAFKTALDITSTGTQRSKCTIHDSSAVNIPYKMATQILSKYGGDLNSIIAQVFKNYNYVFEFAQEEDDKSMKKLVGIVEYRYEAEHDRVSVHRICRYEYESGKWTWNWDIGDDKRTLGGKYPDQLKIFDDTLKALARDNPMAGSGVVIPAYYKSSKEGGDQR
ncbi:MAG TPA: ATPase, T2SS/T4P/T4SS family [Anaerovoracaceae bacterium]|nr:ATPase, T2SS/T4P/T4SS family [Anaerovoracaceae bacterium]